MSIEPNYNDAGTNNRDALNALERLNRLKRLQRKSAATAGTRRNDREHARRDAELVAEVVAELPADDALAAHLDTIERLLYVLCRHGVFQDEDARMARGARSIPEAAGMVSTLSIACELADLRAPSEADWLDIKKRQLEDKAFEERREARAQAALRKDTTAQMLQGLPVHEAERQWVSAMLEALPAPSREAARRRWIEIYEDESRGARESDRYREANLSLLRAASRANPDAAAAVARRTRGAANAP